MEKGYVQVYTGNGKGKTTAALGLSLRAVCAGKKVYFAQFVKGMKYSELNAEKYLPGFSMKQYGSECFIFSEPSEEDIRLGNEGLKECADILSSGDYDVVVLDEINIALYYNLFTVDKVIEAIDNRAAGVEVILTGRNAHERIIEKADLVTEMKEIKHYYEKGVEARVGIEK
ncbi:Cob(I)yrinic acid a,c-diamide adenosyltransferase BtuR (plasmid) [Peptoclostridium acidaminophilum DSM 3953]|uniref:Cob(I)yrinic acid a,c-diamide adenosyltransferase BtuR n=1 Tax=Peptoclostridium acidaminophilum DSM 3953 TaxID=1286171 RepID=W8UBE8_PEPAC|nr:cob(I)yrinic acid a,c-diamide adenosyltransferase [Peptoclostridium acidaminophilum]AHM58091.1 Cob(I)yrinic acid a,c-diamide adenosyltransferase BtuR [Peptoclostridium acidaminophilum DSM 3953]